ncbi:MAG: AAA family ATPase [Pseudomonadota bacterium]
MTERFKPVLELYKSCYKLEGEPFRLSPDHRFSFAHRSYANAKAYLEYALSLGEGFIAITGEAGTGKTTLISDLLEGLDRSRTLVARLTSAHLDLDHLILQVISSFGLQVKGDSLALSLRELEQFLVQRNHRGERAILIVDEAQGLSPASLEELRLLSNLQYEERLLLQIFLVGQDGLLEMIQAPGMEHLHQRLIAASCLEPLDLDETLSYLEYRLCQVGWQGDPAISEGAIRIIHRYSGGIPRRINLISHRLFLHGGVHQKHALTGEDARQVIEDLRKEHLLAAEVATLELQEEELFAQSGDSDDRSRSLPRAESFALARQQGQPSALPVFGEPTAEITPADSAGLAESQDPAYAVAAADSPDAEVDAFTRKTSEMYADHGERPFDPDRSAAGERMAPVGRMVKEPGTAGQSRRWVWATVLILLVGLSLAVFAEKELRDRLIGFMHLVLNQGEHNPLGIPASPREKLATPYALDTVVRTMTPEQTRSSISSKSGTIQRHSTLELRTDGLVGAGPDHDQ